MPKPPPDDEPVRALLFSHDLRPSAHRVAVAQYVLFTDAHPTADEAFAKVRETFPVISRATVYNTLHALVRKGLLSPVLSDKGAVRYDANIDLHHHFIDDETGRIHDISWHAVELPSPEELGRKAGLDGFDVKSYRVTFRGRARRRPARARS